MTRLTRFAACGAAAVACLLAARTAGAQVMCNDLTTLPNPIILTGSSAFEATVKQFAVKLSAETTPTSIIYQVPGSCSGVANFSAALTGTAHYYTLDTTMTPPAVVTNSCTFAAGQMADVAISDVFYESCANVPQPRPSTLTDIPGPVQAMLFVVPKSNSTTQYITVDEAADIYGCGAGASVTPFTQAGGIFCRDPNSGTQITVAKNIGVDASVMVAPVCVPSTNGTAGVISGVTTYATPGSAIGFIGADAYDPVRTTLNSLAFKGFGQTLAYYSDSGPSTADRRNVRDGHYLIWGYEHMIATVDTTGALTNPKAANFIGWINGTKTDPSFDYVQVEGAAGTIPVCAMKVKRASDGGLLDHYTPTDTCSCAFEAAITKTTPAACSMTCTGTGTSTCTGGTACHHGFCE
jgi:ABC-type phosphate transport system substrate-binding protein